MKFSFLSVLVVWLSLHAMQVSASALSPALSQVRPIEFDRLPGWRFDAVEEALPAWLRSCRVLAKRGSPFTELCAQAESLGSEPLEGEAQRERVRAYFESQFQPYLVVDPRVSQAETGTLTGYYEPLVRGSRTPSGPYQHPLYRTPDDLISVQLDSIYPELKGLRLRGRLQGKQVSPYPTRGEIERQELLKGQEIIWLDDPIDAFFMQVQGSGRVQLPDGSSVRLGYANQNGHPYRSIGKWLVDQGALTLAQASMQGIKAWLAQNPGRKDELLHQNPSLVFFRELPDSGDPSEGPIGSLGVPLTAGRSIAVDPRFIPLGLPVVLNTRFADGPSQRLVMAQDTGSAIQGPHRADFFFGSGDAAGELAGRMKGQGQLIALLPRGMTALALERLFQGGSR
ncbi:MAG: putative Membrane-bound lytic murein transglycosylase MltA family [Pseudomonadota bacterium]